MHSRTGAGGVHTLGEVHGSHPVDRRVVVLGIHRELAILEALYEVHFPQGPVAVQQRGVQARHQGEQLPVTPRRGQRRVADVVVDIQVFIRLPVHGAEGTAPGFITENWLEVFSRLQLVGQLVKKSTGICPGRQGEQVHAADMHRRFATLGE